MNPQVDVQVGSPQVVFYAISAAALLAGGFSIRVGITGIRSRNVQVLRLALAFVTLSLLLALHGLATPGTILGAEETYAPASAAASLSILAAAVWLFISSLPSDTPIIRRLDSAPLWTFPLWVVVLVLFNVFALSQPDILRKVPSGFAGDLAMGLNEPSGFFGLSIAVFILLAVSWWNFWRSWRYSRFPLQRAMLYSIALLISAQVVLGFTTPWHVSWWMVHALVLLAVVSLVIGLGKQFRRPEGLEGPFLRELHEKLVYGISDSVRALVLATEARDRYTGGHNLRVALYGLRLARAMELSPEKQRAIAQGGIIHDVGKLHLPDSILNKPGGLTDEEFATVKEHPVTGFELSRHLGMMPEELSVIRHHHERWDGRGYPDGLAGEEIPRVARVLAVADVFDALTSARSYRGAWSHERAHALIRDNASSQFDPDCVAAWQTIPQEEINGVAAVEGFSAAEPQATGRAGRE